MKRVALSLLVWAIGPSLAAEEQWQVTAHVDFFQVTERDALTIISRLRNPKEASAALKALTEEANTSGGQAQRIAALTARALEGRSARIRHGEERRYGIEYEQENLWIGFPPDAPVKLPDATGYPLTSFETRDCGFQFEFSAKVGGDGRTILIAQSTKHVQFDRWTRYETAVRSDGIKLFVEQPVFVRRQSSCVLLTSAETPVLLGSYRIPEEEKTFELHVLTAFARRMDEAALQVDVEKEGEDLVNMVSKVPRDFPKQDMRLEVLTFSIPAA